MGRGWLAIGAMVIAAAAAGGRPASAEVLDAVYRGTLVCDKLPFTKSRMREAIDVTVMGGAASYSHVVRLLAAPEAKAEQGTGAVSGQALSLQGSWEGAARQYKASYSGTFVRRSAYLKGTQTWTGGGKEITRTCHGVVKRPFRIFLPRGKKKSTG